MTISSSALAIHGGATALRDEPGDVFRWPIVTDEDEQAVLEVLRRGAMSGTDVTLKFEEDIKAWHQMDYALCHSNGTQAIQAAMWACGVGVGDEIICQSMTYWASAMQVFSLGGTVVFADMDPRTLTLDPNDIERHITERTKAIVAVHYCAHPSDMDPIMAIAAKHGLKVIEDVSHAQGGLYKGRLLGTIGDVGAMSIMSGKSLPCGEGGILVTNDQKIYDRSVAFGHYQRSRDIEDPELKPFQGMPLGGYKNRMNQMSSAMGRVQLRHYRSRMEEIQQAMNHFWDLLKDVPGLKAHRTPVGGDSTMAGWYAAKGLYVADELGGLPVETFCAAVTAELAGSWKVMSGGNPLMHLHAAFNEADIYGHGKPTRIAHSERDLRQGPGSLPATESLPQRMYSIPWFKRHRPDLIEQCAEAYRKVAENADQLL
jgi:perosamine synthetase